MTDVAKWCILRTGGRHTIPLAKSLADAGFRAWTPTDITLRKVRRGKEVVEIEIEAAITPTFVFARADHLDDLARIRQLPFGPHPDFSIFQRAGAAPLIAGTTLAPLWWAGLLARTAIDAVYERRQLEVERETARQARVAALRTAEQRRKALRSERKDLPPGLQVAVNNSPAFAGMSGVVVESIDGGASALVSFGGAMVWTIEAWQLIPADVSEFTSVPA